MEKYDCIVVGAGPAGLSAGINLVQRGKKCLLADGGDNMLARAEKVDNYLGMPSMSGKAMMNAFVGHAKTNGVEIVLGTVANIYPSGSEFLVNISGNILSAKSIIITCGVAKPKPIDGEEAYLGRGVSYCATCDGMLYRGKKVAVWGTDKSCPTEANYLDEIGCRVFYIAKARPDELHESIAFIKGAPSAIKGEETVSAVIVGGISHDTDGVFLLRGRIAPSALLTGLELSDGFIKTNSACATNIAGVYSAGDVTGKPLQVANAVGDGLVAALACCEYLDTIAK